MLAVIISVLTFLVVLFFLVLVHELGHFIVAKKTGMRVDEFGIGFPPKLFGIKKGETEYTLNALPIGGFVRIFGEDGTDTPSASVANELSNSESESEAVYQSGGLMDSEGVISQNTGRAFVDKSKWAQAAVLVAGVTMNVLFAWFLFATALSIGMPTAVPEEQASENAVLVVTQILPESPADELNIPISGRILSLSTKNAALDELTPSAFRSFLREHEGETFTVGYAVGETVESKEITPVQNVLPDDPDRYTLGMALNMVEFTSQPIHLAVYESFFMTLTALKNVAVGIFGLIADSLVLEADLSQVTGPVGIVGLVGEVSASGFTALLMFTAFISLNLAIINILPFPALDGGRLLFVIIEAIKGSPIRPSWVHSLNMIGLILLILLMVAVTYNDIVRII